MKDYGLVCFDVDGTLVDNLEYSWQLFHEHFQTDKHRREDAKNKFFSGKITYLEWANHDIGLWKEVNAKKSDFFEAIEKNNIRLMNGTEDTIKKLKQKGIKIAIISGTLNVILDKLLPDYENIFDYVFLSMLHFDKAGLLSGATPTEFDMEGKAVALKRIAQKENIDLGRCVFIGDHHNDVKAAEEAGLSIAFNCKSDKLRNAADVVIEKKDIKEILKYVL